MLSVAQAGVASAPGKDEGEVAPFQEQAAFMERDWYLAGLLHAAEHHLLPHLWCAAVLLTLTEFRVGEMHWNQFVLKIIVLSLVDSLQEGAPQSPELYGVLCDSAGCSSCLCFTTG